MKPSEVRTRILADHQELRGLLSEVVELADRILAGDGAVTDALVEKVRKLYEMLFEHLELEDTILAPALRETDAFGPARAEELLAHHQDQRRELSEGLARVSNDDAGDLAGLTRRLAADLLVDMAHEEKDLLNENLLKDDPINVDIFTG